MTGEEQEIQLNFDEEAVHFDGDQVVPDTEKDRSMVATSGEVCILLVFCYRLLKYPNQ